jgi:MscS family membrane protein
MKILGLLLFLVSLNGFSVELSSPRETMKTFLLAMKNYKLGDKEAINIAIKTLNLDHIETTIAVATGKHTAVRLVQTLDRIERINYKNVPQKPKKNIWIYKKHNVKIKNRVYPVEIAIAKSPEENSWRFTQNTVDSISHYWESLKNKKVVKGVIKLESKKDQLKKWMPEWTGRKDFFLLNGQWIGLLFILLAGRLIAALITFNLERVIIGKLAKQHLKLDINVKGQAFKALKYIIMALTWNFGLYLLELNRETLSILIRFGHIVATLSTVVLAFYICDLLSPFFLKKAQATEEKLDDLLVPILTKTAKFIVICLGVVFIGQSLGLDMKGLLAGLGIGGLAFALASKDAISNFFGSLTVLFDRSFHIGDWVVIDNKIEGTVEDVGLRSTKIRTFYNSLITVPNGSLTNAHIDNFAKRKFRRFRTNIGIQYDTPPEKIEAFCEGIRELIIGNNLTRKDYFNVYLNELSDSSLNILVHMFWEVPDYSTELAEKHRLLIDIIRLANNLGVEFAFPTRTLHLFNEEKLEEKVPLPKEEFPQIFGKNLAKDINKKPITPKKPRSAINTTKEFEEDDWLYRG